MNLKEVSTVDLAKELLDRVQHVDAALAILQGGALARELPEKPAARGPYRLTSHDVEAALVAADKPMTSPALAKRLKATVGAVSGHLRRLAEAGAVTLVSNRKPFLYQAKSLSNGASK